MAGQVVVAQVAQYIDGRHQMGVFRRQYPDGRRSKGWYIDYRINGKHKRERIVPDMRLLEAVLGKRNAEELEGLRL
jgi:hypothetical protein